MTEGAETDVVDIHVSGLERMTELMDGKGVCNYSLPSRLPFDYGSLAADMFQLVVDQPPECRGEQCHLTVKERGVRQLSVTSHLESASH
ncbi:hypothetical protein J6590_050482 [Homalodisca vitripennis]|nr:hypothetical protein J6590_050482 [Homalodisca vitripennis]